MNPVDIISPIIILRTCCPLITLTYMCRLYSERCGGVWD